MNFNIAATPPLRRTVLPPESVLARNHLHYVMSDADTLRGYLVAALEIDGTFCDQFSHHDWVTALEHTLHFKPPDVPTEYYLKSQTLWIMHKLLLRLGLREAIQALLAATATPVDTRAPRDELAALGTHFSERLRTAATPVAVLVDELLHHLQQVQQAHHVALGK